MGIGCMESEDTANTDEMGEEFIFDQRALQQQ